jgi:polysaccharide biosynthesis/export protein
MKGDRRSASLIMGRFLVMAMGITLIVGCAPLSRLLDGQESQLNPETVVSIATAETEQGTQVVIQGSKSFSYSLANHEKPPRALIAIPGAQFAQRASLMRVNKGVVQSLTLQERDGQAQVEVALDRLVSYEVQKGEDRLVLNFKNLPIPAVPRGEQSQPQPGVTAASPSRTAERGDATQGSAERWVRLPKVPATGIEEAAPPNPLEYVIGGMDILEIVVYQENDLSGTFRVSADGHIPFPLVGNVRVAGLTPSQAQQRLEDLLKNGYLKRPQVSVIVKEYRSQGVSVLGAVARPGAYPLSGGRTTLLDLLSLAGGVSLEEGSKSLLLLLRPDESGETKSITIDLDRLLKDGDASLNLMVQPNDAVYVTKADSIIVYGEVKNPGTFPIQSKGMTVLEAVSRAGGFTDYAAPNRTRIIRVDRGVEKSIQVRVGDIIAKGERRKDLTLQPGDVIVVPQGYF